MTITVNIPDRLKRLMERAALANGGMASEAARNAVQATALDVREMLADATPKDTGNTAKRWQVTKDATLDDPTAVVSNDSVIMLYLEYGTPPHKITAKNGKALAFPASAGRAADGRRLFRSAATGKAVLSVKRAATVLVQSVNHPGTKAQFIVRGRTGKIRQMLAQHTAAEIARLVRG